MLPHRGIVSRDLILAAVLLAAATAGALSGATWSGVLRDSEGKPVGEAIIKLRPKSGDRGYTARTSANGNFVFSDIDANDYELSVEAAGTIWHAANPVTMKDGDALSTSLQVFTQPQELRLLPSREVVSVTASGG